MISSTMPSTKYSCSGSPLMFWNGKTAIDGLSGNANCGLRFRSASLSEGGIPPRQIDAIDAYRPHDVLDLLLAHVVETEVELVTHLVADNSADTQIPPGSAKASSRAATLTPSPKMSPSSMMMSPRLMPIRNSMRRSAGTPVFRSSISRCTSTAQRTASTTLANSTSMPSPVVLTMRPRCSLILGSTTSRRSAFNAASVPSSSAPISREYEATSAARIAASRRSTRSPLILQAHYPAKHGACHAPSSRRQRPKWGKLRRSCSEAGRRLSVQ